MNLKNKSVKVLVKAISFPSKLLPSRWLRKMNRDQRRAFNLIATGTFIVVGTWVGTSLLLPEKSEASWWDDSWRYRQIVTATNNSPFTASDTPYRILMDTASPIAGGKMKADGGDIRVVDNEGKIVRFQVEQSTLNTTETGIWFDADIPADSSSTYYIYYGNNSATTPSFTSDIASNVGSGTTVTTNDGFEYTTTTSYGRVSTIKKNGTNVGVNGHMKQTGSFTGNWWGTAAFTRTQLASGPLFVEIDFNDTNKDHYSSFGNRVKLFKNGFVEEQTYMNYNNNGNERLYYYLSFTSGTRNSVWVDSAETLIDQAPNSGNLTRASLGHNWFGQRWTDTGNYGGTIISPKTADWSSGQTSAQDSYYQTNYSSFEDYATGSARLIRFGTFAGSGTVNQMHEHASLLGSQSTTLSSEEVGPGPIAYWKFDEGTSTTANDSTQNSNTGTITGASWVSDCISGKCLDFDQAQSDYVTATADTLNSISNEITVTAWVKWRGNGAGGDSMQMVLANISNGSFRFGTRTPTTTGLFAVYCGVCSTPAWYEANALPRDQWHHIAVTMDGTTLKMYQNGVLTKTSSYSGNIINSTATWAIGTYSGDTYNWNGLIDELKVYPYARDQEQILTDYNTGAASVLGAKNSTLNNGLISYWKMDEPVWNGTIGEIADSSGNNNNLTATSASASAGKFGNSGTFDGTEDYIEWANVPSTMRPNIRTRSYWVKPAALNNNRIYSTIAALSGDGLLPDSGYHGRTYSRIDTSGAVTIGFSSYSCSGTASFLNFSHTSTDTLSVGKWHHITEVIDYTNPTIKIYIDGKYQGANSTSGYTCSTNEWNWWIGRRKTNNDFSGQLDEFRLYNRELTGNEVQQLYNFAPPPVAYYDFEEKTGTTVFDKSGNGNNSSSFGGNPQWVQGKYGSGIDFDGTDDNIRITQNIMSSSDSTISFWLKIPTQASNYKRIMSDATGGVEVYFTSTGTNGIYGSIGNSTAGWVMSSPDLTGNWQYVTLVSTASDSMTRAYLNGKLQSTTNKIYSSITLDDLYLGSTSAGSYYLDGTLDELKIYNYARTPSQIIEDMNAGHPIGGSPIGSQLAYYKLDEGNGTTANDSIGSYNGTISNATWTNSGKLGKALTFNGTTSQIDLGTTLSAVNTYGGADGASTLSMWIYPTTDNTERNIISFAGGWYYIGLNSSGKLQGMARDCTGNVNWWHYGNAVIPLNQWTHIAVELTGDGAKYYVNGKLDAASSDSDVCLYHTGTARIGYSHVGWDYFSGMIDNIKIYATSLTEDQIKVDYNNGKSLQLGVLGTEADGTPSNSSDRAYCPPGDTTATCGPIGEWKFDEMTGTTAKDTSGNGNDGTIVGEPAWQPKGKVGSALGFSGTNEYVNIGDLSSVEQATVTFTAWIKPASTNTDDDIITKGVHTQNQPLVIWRDDVVGGGSDIGNTDALSVIVYDGTTQHWFASPSNSLNDTNWHHIAVAIVPGNYMKIYIDGVLVRTGTMTNTGIQNTAHNLRIGNDTNLGAADFDGLIDHVQVFNYELSPAQIAWNVNRGAPIAHYRLNECQGSTVKSSNNPYNPSLNGTISIGASGTQTSAGNCQTSGTAWGNGASGKFNGSLSFDGTDDAIAIASFPNLPTNTISVASWVKINTHKNWNSFVRHDWVGDGWLLYSNASGNVYFGIGQAGVQYNASKTNVSTDEWHFVVGTYDGTTVKVYVDGVLGTPTSLTNAALDNAGSVYIGGQSSSIMDGQLDEVQIYNYALTPQQIKTIMNQGAIRFGP